MNDDVDGSGPRDAKPAAAGNLAELLRRVENARGPDKFFDADLCKVLHPHDHAAHIWRDAKRYTGSIDAVLALIDEKLPGWQWAARRGVAIYEAIVFRYNVVTFKATAQTPALALLAALLKALLDTSAPGGSSRAPDGAKASTP